MQERNLCQGCARGAEGSHPATLFTRSSSYRQPSDLVLFLKKWLDLNIPLSLTGCLCRCSAGAGPALSGAGLCWVGRFRVWKDGSALGAPSFPLAIRTRRCLLQLDDLSLGLDLS